MRTRSLVTMGAKKMKYYIFDTHLNEVCETSLVEGVTSILQDGGTRYDLRQDSDGYWYEWRYYDGWTKGKSYGYRHDSEADAWQAWAREYFETGFYLEFGRTLGGSDRYALKDHDSLYSMIRDLLEDTDYELPEGLPEPIRAMFS